MLRRGATGEDVRTLQASLKAQGYNVNVDGAFGPMTEAAVMAFQRDHALAVDGVVGPITWARVLAPTTSAPKARPAYPTQRCWPLRCLADGRKPQVTSGHKSVNPERPNHNGCDLFYRYLPSDPPKKIGDSGRTANWWIPENTLAIAPFDGVIVLASVSPTGYRVWLEHQETTWKVGFFHFDELRVKVGQVVSLGHALGRVNDNPIDQDPDHLHFELYWGDLGHYSAGSVDPEPMLAHAPYLAAV